MRRGRKEKKARSDPGAGLYYSFHGAFSDKARAEAKARERGGWVLKRTIRGRRRHIVPGEKVPF